MHEAEHEAQPEVFKKSKNPKIAIARPATNKKAKANFVALTCSFVA
jgi:hypothetical protein